VPRLVFKGTVAFIEADHLLRSAVAVQIQNLGAQVNTFAHVDEFIAHFENAECPHILLYGFWPRREKQDTNLSRWLAWCEAHHAKPILLFPSGERRLVGFYRKRGVTCLFHPLRSEALLKDIEAVDTAQQTAPMSTSAVADCRGFRLLVADDNDINRLLLRSQLQGFEADIVEACNGREALERLRQQRFDLVFLDLQMPLMDGAQVLRGLRGNNGYNRHVPVVAITAYATPAYRDSLIADGFAECLIKPILEEQLVRLIDAWLEGDRARFNRGDESPEAVEAYANIILERTGNKLKLADVIARKLFAELPENLRQAEEAIRNRDTPTARMAVHKINGSCAFCGLEVIREAAASIESALNYDKDWQRLDILYQQLAREVGHFLPLENAILARFANVDVTTNHSHQSV
jgi:CheY-like chemotaxis protein